MNEETIDEIEESYENVSHVAGLDVFAIEGRGLYAANGDGTIWQLASEEYIAVKPDLANHYPYTID